VTTTTIHAAGNADILAAIAYRLGFSPRESLVLVAVRERGTLGLIVRADLNDATQAEDWLAEKMLSDGAVRVLAITYTDRPNVAGQTHDTVSEWFAPGTVHSICVDSRGYRDRSDAPESARPLSDLDSCVVAASSVVAGKVVAKTRAGLLPARVDRFTCRKVERAALATEPMDEADAVRAWVDYVANPCDDLTTIATLAATLVKRPVRDAVLMLATGASIEVATHVAQGGDGAEVTAALARVLTGTDRPTPQDAAWATAIGQIARHVVTAQFVAPAWTLWAVTQWWAGGTAAANDALDIALKAEPSYRLASLMNQACARGMGPGWTRRH
jgi:hypothetical protein